MKKILLIVLAAVVLGVVVFIKKSGSDYQFATGSGWSVVQNDKTKVVLQGPGYRGKTQETYTFYRYSKSVKQKLEDWLAAHKNELPSSTYEGTCSKVAHADKVSIYNCGRWAAEYFLTHEYNPKMLYITLGQDPPLEPEGLLRLVSFK